MVRETWPEFFMGMAEYVRTRSKDPSTRVGAVIARPDHTVASMGFNGFPRGVTDTEERYENREFKYPAVVHAELNAILNAREPVRGYTLYTTFHPCARCAATIVQAGIKTVIVPKEEIPERWKADMAIASTLLREAGVGVLELELP